MKWVLMVLSYFINKFSNSQPAMNPVQEMKEFVIDNAKKVLLALVVSNVLALLFVTGLTLTVLTLSAQDDRFNGMLGGSIGILALSLIASFFIFRQGNDDKKERKMMEQQQAQNPTIHPLEEALVKLIADFIKEKETVRDLEKEEERKERGHERVPSAAEATAEYDH